MGIKGKIQKQIRKHQEGEKTVRLGNEEWIVMYRKTEE